MPTIEDDSHLDRSNPWTTHDSRFVYENPWIRVREDRVTNPAGGAGIYGVVEYRNRAVGVIPVDEDGHTWLVGQYRYTTNTFEWEIPEGGCPEGEDLLTAARRELAEETGLVAESYETILAGLQLSNSVTNERACIYVARGITQSEAAPEETEKIAVRRMPLEEAFAMVDRGEINDVMSVAGLMKLRHLMLQNK